MAQAQRDITLIYQGVDITDEVDIIECVCRDVSSAESDCLNLKLDHAENWFRWKPQKNDTLRVTRGGYDSKTMYLNTVVPEGGAYRIYATARKSAPMPEKYQAFEKMTLSSIMSMCAAECGMGAKLYGISGGVQYPYLLREKLRAPVFMEMLAMREGAVLKCLDGNFAAIGVQYAQGISAMHEMELDDDQMDSQYIDRRDLAWSSVQIKSMFGSGTARDSNSSGQAKIITDLAVDDDATAYRWAKGILLMHNRQSEVLNIEMDFNPGYTAMVRVDVKSSTDAAGKWVIDNVEQNLLDGRTKARMYRCIDGVK